jgi:hypothetical protein
MRVSTQEAKILVVSNQADLLVKPVTRDKPSVNPDFFPHLRRPVKFGQRFHDGPFYHMGFFMALPALGGFGRDPEGHPFLPAFEFPPFGCPLECGQRLHLDPFCHILVFGGSACSRSWLGLVNQFLLPWPGPILGCLPLPPQSRSPLLDGSLPLLLGCGFQCTSPFLMHSGTRLPCLLCSTLQFFIYDAAHQSWS